MPIMHKDSFTRYSLAMLKQSKIGKGDLVLLEFVESGIKNPATMRDSKYIQSILDFIKSKGAHISSFEPEEIGRYRADAHTVANLSGKINKSEVIGTDLGAEEVMADVIQRKMGGQKKSICSNWHRPFTGADEPFA